MLHKIKTLQIYTNFQMLNSSLSPSSISRVEFIHSISRVEFKHAKQYYIFHKLVALENHR